MRPQWVILAGGILVTVGIRGWLASRVSTPWLFSDELIHSELAKNLASGSLFEIRGEHVNVTYAYPLVLAPAWLLPSLASTYAVAKAINIVLLSAAAIPGQGAVSRSEAAWRPVRSGRGRHQSALPCVIGASSIDLCPLVRRSWSHIGCSRATRLIDTPGS